MCECGAFEDTQHIFMPFTRYTNLQQELANRVTPMYQLSLNVLLFSSQELSDSSKRQIFLDLNPIRIQLRDFDHMTSHMLE